MVKYCVAFGCKNIYMKGNETLFHRFPHARQNVLKQWIRAIRRKNWKPTTHSVICSDHFTEDCYKIRPGGARFKYLKEDAVPSLFNFPEHLQKRLKKRREPLGRTSKLVKGRVVNEKAVLKQAQTTVTTKRKGGQLPYKKLNTTENKNGSQVFTRAAGPLSRRRKFIPSQPIDTSYYEGDDLVNSMILKEEDRCFVCEKHVSDGGTPLETLTTTSRAPMRHRLDRIAAGARGHLDLSQDPGGVLCSHCTCVLNHLDQIEVELNLLTKSVLNALLKKYGLVALVNDDVEVDENGKDTYLEIERDMENRNNHSIEVLAAPVNDFNNRCQGSIDQINDFINQCKDSIDQINDFNNQCKDSIDQINDFEIHSCDFCNLYIEEGEIHTHGNKPTVIETVVVSRKDNADIQSCPTRATFKARKVLKVSEKQVNDTSITSKSSTEKMLHDSVVEARKIRKSKDSVGVGLGNLVKEKSLNSSEINFSSDFSFVPFPRTKRSPHIITSTLSDPGGKHEIEILNYISSDVWLKQS